MITSANLATPARVALLVLAGVTPLAAALPEAEILARIDQRIAAHRQGDAVVSVITSAGTPVRQARVTVHQTAHAFLFGCNIYMWGRNGHPRHRPCGRNSVASNSLANVSSGRDRATPLPAC